MNNSEWETDLRTLQSAHKQEKFLGINNWLGISQSFPLVTKSFSKEELAYRETIHRYAPWIEYLNLSPWKKNIIIYWAVNRIKIQRALRCTVVLSKQGVNRGGWMQIHLWWHCYFFALFQRYKDPAAGRSAWHCSLGCCPTTVPGCGRKRGGSKYLCTAEIRDWCLSFLPAHKESGDIPWGCSTEVEERRKMVGCHFCLVSGISATLLVSGKQESHKLQNGSNVFCP